MSFQDPSIYLGGCWVWCSAGISSTAEAALTAEVRHYLSLYVSLHTAVTPALIRQPNCTLPFISEYSWHSVTWTPSYLCFSIAKDYWQTSTSAESYGVNGMCWRGECADAALHSVIRHTIFSRNSNLTDKHWRGTRVTSTDQKITETRECRTLQNQPGTKHLATMHNTLLTT